MNILITGKTGYISANLENWLMEGNTNIVCERISLREHLIDNLNLEKYETIVHTAAIVHKKENQYSEDEYFKINCDLTIKLAQKAKVSGVKHFIFLSTMSVFGLEGHIGCKTTINSKTELKPKSYYGKSKLAAEVKLKELQSKDFSVAIIRPPMVYGPDCPGNYYSLSKIAKLLPVFPYIKNKRSMIYINNLCEFIKLVIEDRANGTFHPQNSQYVSTMYLITEIATLYNKKIYFSKALGRLITKFFPHLGIVKKSFGSLIYDREYSLYQKDYQVNGFKDSIKKTEYR